MVVGFPPRFLLATSKIQAMRMTHPTPRTKTVAPGSPERTGGHIFPLASGFDIRIERSFLLVGWF